MPSDAAPDHQVDGPDGVLQERLRPCTEPRLLVSFQLILHERRRGEISGGRIQNGSVARFPDIFAERVRQPQEVVAAPGADALVPQPGAVNTGMPPVLDVALIELVGGGAQEMGARRLGRLVHNGADILQLIPEAVSAAALIQRGPRKDAACQRLIGGPAVLNTC